MEINKSNVSSWVENHLERLSIDATGLSFLLDLKNGVSKVASWQSGKSVPTKTQQSKLNAFPSSFPYKPDSSRNNNYTFIDLFAGVGGIRQGFQLNGGRCVFSSEWDKHAAKTYFANYGELPSGDITKISVKEIPSHDVLVGGFPCQAFSQAGLKGGFSDTRGTMFFEIQRILEHHHPKVVFLENVKQLCGHDGGNTLKVIYETLTGELSSESKKIVSGLDRQSQNKLNYEVRHYVLRARDFGVPQNRERVFIIGLNRDEFSDTDINSFYSDLENDLNNMDIVPTRLGDILEDSRLISNDYTISDKLWSGHQRRKSENKLKGKGFGYNLFTESSPYANTISARYYKDGSEILIDQSSQGKNPRMLTEREAARLQGFPEDFVLHAVSKNQFYKQMGNSVAVPVINYLAQKINVLF